MVLGERARVVRDELMGGAERGGVCGGRHERSSDSPVEQRAAARPEPPLPRGAEVAAKRERCSTDRRDRLARNVHGLEPGRSGSASVGRYRRHMKNALSYLPPSKTAPLKGWRGIMRNLYLGVVGGRGAVWGLFCIMLL